MRVSGRVLLLVISCLSLAPLAAQEKPIGSWSSLFQYNIAYGVVSGGNKLYVMTDNAFYVADYPIGSKMETYNKVNGMSDVGMQVIAYDPASGYTVLVYSDGNIDLFKNNTFYNIPDFKIKSITGDKAIFQVYVESGMAYICTSIGILVVDLQRQLISETYQFIINNQIIPINGMVGLQDSFYAITATGLYAAPKTSNQLQNFAAWTHVDSTTSYNFIANQNGLLYLASKTNVYTYNSGSVTNLYTSPASISHIDGGLKDLFISEFYTSSYKGVVKKLSAANTITDSLSFAGNSSQVTQLPDSSIWIANNYSGLGYWSGIYFYNINPPGPADKNSFGLYANNGNVWIAHGGYSDLFLPDGNPRGISNYTNGKWNLFQDWYYAPFYDSLQDFISVITDESNGTVYGASFGGYSYGGLWEYHPADQSYKIYKNDVFERGISSGGWELAGMTLDASNNLWVTTYTSPVNELYIKEKSSGNWYKIHVNVPRNPTNDGGPIVVDDAGEAWYVCDYGEGVIAYNTNNTFGDVSDDSYRHLNTGIGSGNLPSNNCFSIAKDLSGDIWIGTDNGIGIVYQTTSCIANNCDAVIPIVQYDAYAGYLFSGENVRAIVVDGANRKWVGTDNGVWLLSPDASTIIYRFTVDNSPLPSNRIQSIAIDKVTGDVYFGTDQGLVSFRSTATQGGDTNHNVMIFPNPVQKGYTGTIAISGLVANADVRITDIDGQLVFKTTAFGGQAIWNGVDYKGHRPQSGVYLVYVTNTDNSGAGTQTYVGKIVFIQ